MMKDIFREITPLIADDCFTIFSRTKAEFNFPLHMHEEIELNLILHAAGTKRIVGDHIEEIGPTELVLVGPNLPHGWFTHHCKSECIHEVTIQFHKDILSEGFLRKTQLTYIRRMLEDARRGILFSEQTAQTMTPRILSLNKKNGFDSVLELFSLLNDLSTARNSMILSTMSHSHRPASPSSRRLERVFDFLNQHYRREISLEEVAKVANMPKASFSRFFKNHTGYTYTESLNEIRLGHVCRMLIDTTHSVAEIALKCGYNNMAYFNKIFKSRKGLTPKDFKKNYNGHRMFV
ncbi:MAG: AraC family transcriptional regulator [Candidatus Pseudobacter hemicellulosilyticus]|uniref:AraC family transcriptional regulator n=1 Tax=Candidatus Pseudobacter hemicellulosilyticus TaxID=3121375 RepID=A0AAJ6BH78_9BACT|nr:MAG: AraC family transcriptional regulator [Pseudobacter sp.]